MSLSGAAAISPAGTDTPRTHPNALLWSVRRELWENRFVYVAPFAAAAIVLIGFILRMIAAPETIGGTPGAAAATRHEEIREPYIYAALLLMGTGVVVGIFYSLDALYAERRDRSILFWKSLPVSDWTTVLSKASVSFVILPLLTTALTVVVHLLMLLSSSVVLMFAGLGVSWLWGEVSPLRLTFELVYHMVTIHILWYAPFYAWLLLASAWARRAPFLWAGIPILAVLVIEHVVFNSSVLLDMLKFRLAGSGESFANSGNPLVQVHPDPFFLTASLWIGLALAMVLLAATVQVRRRNGPA